MDNRPTLFRDFSAYSEKAETLLQENHIDYVRQYVDPAGTKLPYLIHQTGVFHGSSGIQIFVDGFKIK